MADITIDSIKSQFDTYLNENKMVGLDELIKDPKQKIKQKKQVREVWEENKDSGYQKKRINPKYAKKGGDMVYAPKNKNQQWQAKNAKQENYEKPKQESE